jgi:hypothetical protein
MATRGMSRIPPRIMTFSDRPSYSINATEPSSRNRIFDINSFWLLNVIRTG